MRIAESDRSTFTPGERDLTAALSQALAKTPRAKGSGRKREDPNWVHLHTKIPLNLKALIEGYCRYVGVKQQDLTIAVFADFFARQGFDLNSLFGVLMPPDQEIDDKFLQELMKAGATPKANGRSADK